MGILDNCLSDARQFLLGVYNYLSDLPPYLCSIKKSALYEDQRTALSFYVAAKIVPMKVLEVSICKPWHWNLDIGIGTILQTPIERRLYRGSYTSTFLFEKI